MNALGLRTAQQSPLQGLIQVKIFYLLYRTKSMHVVDPQADLLAANTSAP